MKDQTVWTNLNSSRHQFWSSNQQKPVSLTHPVPYTFVRHSDCLQHPLWTIRAPFRPSRATPLDYPSVPAKSVSSLGSIKREFLTEKYLSLQTSCKGGFHYLFLFSIVAFITIIASNVWRGVWNSDLIGSNRLTAIRWVQLCNKGNGMPPQKVTAVKRESNLDLRVSYGCNLERKLNANKRRAMQANACIVGTVSSHVIHMMHALWELFSSLVIHMMHALWELLHPTKSVISTFSFGGPNFFFQCHWTIEKWEKNSTLYVVIWRYS